MKLVSNGTSISGQKAFKPYNHYAMRRPKRRRRKKYKLTDDLPVEEMIEAMIEVLGERPTVARTAKARADAEGLSLDAWLWKTVANGLHRDGVPLPPKLRKHIAEHPDMPDALRKKLLTRDFN
jgi:hypothetical protein